LPTILCLNKNDSNIAATKEQLNYSFIMPLLPASGPLPHILFCCFTLHFLFH